MAVGFARSTSRRHILDPEAPTTGRYSLPEILSYHAFDGAAVTQADPIRSSLSSRVPLDNSQTTELEPEHVNALLHAGFP